MSTIRVNSIVDNAGGNTAIINGMPLRPGSIDPDNRIINGAFDFWQRGTSFTTGLYTGYTADRWFLQRSGGNASAIQGVFPIGTTLGPNNPRYYLTMLSANQSASTDVVYCEQRVESVRTYAGQTVTVLGWARRSSGTGNMGLTLAQWYGTGGSPSTANLADTSYKVTLTSSWQPFACTFVLPSITGKTLGTNGDDAMLVRFFASAGSTYDSQSGALGLQTIGIDFWGVHMKVGTHGTNSTDLYRAPDYTTELLKAQRYYHKSYLVDVVPGAVTNVGALTTSPDAATLFKAFGTTYFPVSMRTSPTITAYNPVTGTSGISTAVRNQAASTNIPVAISDVGQKGFNSFINNTSTAQSAYLVYHFTADAEL